MKHRCAVCWQEQANHDGWYAHATEVHGAVLAEFGYDRCRPGELHTKRLRGEGAPPVRRQIAPQPIKARDGTTYTPIPLFPERSA